MLSRAIFEYEDDMVMANDDVNISSSLHTNYNFKAYVFEAILVGNMHEGK